jgi:hypothetical protein
MRKLADLSRRAGIENGRDGLEFGVNIVQDVILQIGYQRVKCIRLCVFFA